MVCRVVQEDGYEDHVVLVGVCQAEVVTTSLGVYLTDPCLLGPGYKKWMPIRIGCFLVLLLS